jgi:PIN domain nuclease of toxin-antitoxin system
LSLLLDSHVLLWLMVDDPRVSRQTWEMLEEGSREVLVSAVSIWELEVKRMKGTLDAPDDMLPRAENAGFRFVDLTPDNALDAARLPPHHGDPFDRLLVAQAQAEAATLVTHDEALAAYDVPVMRVAPY